MAFPSPRATVTVANNAALLPLMDMTSAQNYLGFEGGLYENSSDTVPRTTTWTGRAAACH